MARQLSLTQAHVDRVHRQMADPGPLPGTSLHDDADYATWVARILATRPQGEPVLLFAFGSLIWKPEVPVTAEALAVARGWHRAFCLRITRFRGSAEVPGLMMALDRGGQCSGVVFTLPEADLAGQLDRLFRREFTAKPINNMPKWIKVAVAGKPLHALAFVMNRASPAYAGRLKADEVAATLARSCGHWGSGAEYLLNTVLHLEARGIQDRALWQLQKLVAGRIETDARQP